MTGTSPTFSLNSFLLPNTDPHSFHTAIKKTSWENSGEDSDNEELKTSTTTPKHKSRAFNLDKINSDISKEGFEDVKQNLRSRLENVAANTQTSEVLKKLEEIANALPSALELSPPKILENPGSPKIAPLVLDWEYKDMEVVRTRYLSIARVICGIYYQWFQQRNESIGRVFGSEGICEIMDERIVRSTRGTLRVIFACAENIQSFEFDDPVDFVFIREEEPTILTVTGKLKTFDGRILKFMQSFKVAPRSVYSHSLVNIGDWESILDHYCIIHARIRLDPC